jgi:hypothetical protein
MGDKDFDVDRLAETMGAGRSMFFEKVGESMHQTPMARVMTCRFDRAAQMLSAAEGSVGEAAYAVRSCSVSTEGPEGRPAISRDFTVPAGFRGERAVMRASIPRPDIQPPPVQEVPCLPFSLALSACSPPSRSA